jgi:hypothetical protein
MTHNEADNFPYDLREEAGPREEWDLQDYPVQG